MLNAQRPTQAPFPRNVSSHLSDARTKAPSAPKAQAESWHEQPMLAEWIYATFKARVSRATLARLRNLPSSYFSHVDLSATKRRRVKFPQFERELKEFFFQNEAKTAMADDVLLLKAHGLAERLGIDSTQLSFSNGWLQSFKKRNGIRSHVLHGEGGAVEDDAEIFH
ncbi:uncharacterized protein IUM83_03594 [Phytophthora cinnamomi]|uniref:uncharacterized protein n=1 Tax=Phytophthora cinnamomi TaxID=4785 RepID=UPI003559C21F|nr:hypothetical protein IUM83_03594 [Phytophthora cinnamomi]